ncbi:MAG: Hsp20/alpha crystallin family protein [Chlamydiae bacterium]|nr:Hsp20/alpha crystallin family protein [Chlamydiota bacterium]
MTQNKHVTVKNPFHSLWSPFFDLVDEPFKDHMATLNQMGENVSISEDEGHFYVEASVPGLHENDIEVTLSKGVLWIKGERKSEEEDKNRRYYKKIQRSFSYRIAVPEDIPDQAHADAYLKNGILHINLPKTKESPRKISVHSKS